MNGHLTFLTGCLFNEFESILSKCRSKKNSNSKYKFQNDCVTLLIKACKRRSAKCAQIGRFIALWATFLSLWQKIILPKSTHFRQILKGVKIFHFSSEIIFGPLFIVIWRFFTGHATGVNYVQKIVHKL